MEMQEAPPHTLLKNALAKAETIFLKRVNCSRTLQKNKNSFHITVRTLTDTALNVVCFGQSVCRLDNTLLRTDRGASVNSGFKKLAVQWLNEYLCFVSSAVLVDSLCSLFANFSNPQNDRCNSKIGSKQLK